VRNAYTSENGSGMGEGHAVSKGAVLVAGVVTFLLSQSCPLAMAEPASDVKDAAPEPIVGILDMQVSGVSSVAAAKFEEAIERGLVDNGFQVAPRSRLTEVLSQSSYVPGCFFGPCLQQVFRNTELRLVLVGRVSSIGPRYDVVLTLLDTRLGRTTSQVVDRCEVCTLEEAITTTTLGVVELVTGAGTAMVDPALGPTSSESPPDLALLLQRSQQEVSVRQRRLRQAAVFFLGAAAIVGGAGAYFAGNDRRIRGYSMVSAGGVFALASTTLLVLSRRF